MAVIFITGATGFIGSHTALRALQQGHRVRLSVRRADQIDKLRQIFSAFLEQLEFVIVSDITKPGAFDHLLQDVDYVFHLSSPLPGREGDFVTTAVKGTVGILQSSLKNVTIKKVIVMSSFLSLIPQDGFRDGVIVKENNEMDYTIDESKVHQDAMGPYHASKIASHKATLDFIDSHNPAFTVYLGVHISDIVDAHIAALSDTVHSHRAYLLCGGRHSWEEVHDFISKEWPTVELKLQPKSRLNLTVDVSKAERELGMKFRPMEEQVRDVVEQQLAFMRV